jgi:hypothetical protein
VAGSGGCGGGERGLGVVGHYFRASLEAQVAMFPHMMTPMVAKLIDRYRDVALGWKLSGAGYLILVADHPVDDGFQITIRREDY